MNKEQTASLLDSIGGEQTTSSQAELSVAVTPNAAQPLTQSVSDIEFQFTGHIGCGFQSAIFASFLRIHRLVTLSP